MKASCDYVALTRIHLCDQCFGGCYRPGAGIFGMYCSRSLHQYLSQLAAVSSLAHRVCVRYDCADTQTYHVEGNAVAKQQILNLDSAEQRIMR